MSQAKCIRMYPGRALETRHLRGGERLENVCDGVLVKFRGIRQVCNMYEVGRRGNFKSLELFSLLVLRHFENHWMSELIFAYVFGDLSMF